MIFIIFLKKFHQKIFYKPFLFIFCLSIFLNSCIGRRLDVQTIYLTEASLASTIVQTPDPQLSSPPMGQRLLIQWNYRKDFAEYHTLSFILSLRFCNHETQTIEQVLTDKRGTYVYEILNKDYFRTGGIIAYSLQIYGDQTLIDSWTHPLWKEFIQLDPL